MDARIEITAMTQSNSSNVNPRVGDVGRLRFIACSFTSITDAEIYFE
jgi:hypothetical protein